VATDIHLDHFTIEVEGSLGDFATANLFLVDNLKARMKQRNQMIAQLQIQIRNTEKNIRDYINKGLEQARVVDKQEIHLLKSSLDDMYKKIQSIQGNFIQQEELVSHLQDKLSSIQSQVANITVFQAQALEVHQKLEEEKQSLFSKVDIIQNYFLEVSQSLKNISFKGKEATIAQASFKKEVIFSAKEVSITPRLFVT
jgi:chromosome segregation ATPase